MIRIGNEKELLDSFRPLDREMVELPKDIGFPFILKDYMAWIEPSGARVFLVYTEPGKKLPLGISFRRNQSTHGTASRMCDWCHSTGGSDKIGLLTAQSSDRKWVGLQLCLDLSCKDNEESPGFWTRQRTKK